MTNRLLAWTAPEGGGMGFRLQPSMKNPSFGGDNGFGISPTASCRGPAADAPWRAASAAMIEDDNSLDNPPQKAGP